MFIYWDKYLTARSDVEFDLKNEKNFIYWSNYSPIDVTLNSI